MTDQEDYYKELLYKYYEQVRVSRSDQRPSHWLILDLEKQNPVLLEEFEARYFQDHDNIITIYEDAMKEAGNFVEDHDCDFVKEDIINYFVKDLLDRAYNVGLRDGIVNNSPKQEELQIKYNHDTIEKILQDAKAIWIGDAFYSGWVVEDAIDNIINRTIEVTKRDFK